MNRFIFLWVFVLVASFGTSAQAADDWFAEVVSATKGFLTECVGPKSPRSVYVLNATSGEHMSATEERRAVNDLTSALRTVELMQVIHGSVLPYEAYLRGNTPEGQAQMYDLLFAQSNATVTLFVVPLERGGRVVYAEVIYLVRDVDGAASYLTCAGGINVDIPVGSQPAPPPPPLLGDSICAPAVDDLVVTRVDEFATLRAGTSYDDPVVAQARRGATVAYTGSRKLAKPSKAQRCEDLCRGELDGTLEGSDRAAFSRCIEDDVFWLNVRTARGQVGWMSAKYLRFPKDDDDDNIRVGTRNGCRVVLAPHENALDAAETFVDLYYADLSARRVRCAESRWLDPPDDLAEMIVEFASARLSYNELDRARSGQNRAYVDVVAHIGTTDGQQTAWRVTLTLVASRNGWLIEEMHGYIM